AQGLLDEILPGFPVLDQLVEERGGKGGAMTALVLQDDLGEGHRGQILPGGDVDHGDLAARPDELLELFERHVAALLRVVELAIRVSLDNVRHGGNQSSTAHVPSQGEPRREPRRREVRAGTTSTAGERG